MLSCEHVLKNMSSNQPPGLLFVMQLNPIVLE